MSTRFSRKFPHDTEDAATVRFDAVFATTHDGHVFRVSDPQTYSRSLLRWSMLEDMRRKGCMPHVKLFEVRAVFVGADRPIVGPEITSHDRYDGAPLDMFYATMVVAGSKGFKNIEDAAREAWKRAFPTFRSWYDRRTGSMESTGVQGCGGWFFYPNGQTATQGLGSLAKLCKAKRMVVQGADGRWYVMGEAV
jgi:hypothetical protein